MKAAGVIFALLFFPAFASSTIIHVPDDYPTIQDAIDAASNGDEVIVRPGTYVENINFLGKAIAVRSEQGAEVTTIDGGNPLDPDLGSVVSICNYEGRDSIIDGFRIRNGTGTLDASYGTRGGGIYCEHISSPTIINNIIVWNVADDQGGGIFCNNGSHALIRNNVIAWNRAENTSYGQGGGISCNYASSPEIIDNLIISNDAEDRGGGIGYCTNSAPPITGNLIVDNFARDDGGGIFCGGPEAPSISNNTFIGNRANGDGGGVCCSNAYARFVNNSFIDNSAGGSGGGMLCRGNAITPLFNNLFAGNDAGSWGGGVMCDHSYPDIYGNTFAENSATNGGGGFWCEDSSIVEIANTIFWNNVSPVGSAIGIGGYRVTIFSISYADIDGGRDSFYADPDYGIFYWGAGMIDVDPLFVDPARDDYHLTWNSPCRDSGNSFLFGMPPTDFEGDPRIALDAVDMGADEFHFHLYAIGIVTPGETITIRAVGVPSMSVKLYAGLLGSDPLWTQHGPFYLQWPPEWTGLLGKTEGDGILDWNVTVPTTWSFGEVHHLQALVGPWGGAYTRLTNLMTLRVE